MSEGRSGVWELGRRKVRNHREGENGDHRRERGPNWTTLLLAGALVTLLGYTLSNMWEGEQTETQANTEGRIDHGERLGVAETQIKTLEKGVEGLETGQQMILETLYTLPSERSGTAPKIHEEEE